MQRKPWLRGRIWPLIGSCAVFGLWLVSAAANFHAGTSLSSDVGISFTLGVASICADIMKAVSLFVVAAAIINSRPVVTVLGLIVFALCASWSMRSATQFVSSTLENKAAEQTLNHDLQTSSLDLLKTKSRRAEFLAQQSVQVNVNNKYARLDAIGENQRSSKEFDALVHDIEAQQRAIKNSGATIAGDPIAQLFGLSDRTVILVSALFFAALLEVVSGVGFWIIAQSRIPKPAKSDPLAYTPVTLVHGYPVIPQLHVVQDDDPNPPGQKQDKKQDVLADIVVPELPMPNNVIPMRPTRTSSLKSIVSERFEPGKKKDRISLSECVALINASLPEDERIETPRAINKQVCTAVAEAFPNADKRKVGGTMYVYGVRPRPVDLVRAA